MNEVGSYQYQMTRYHLIHATTQSRPGIIAKTLVDRCPFVSSRKGRKLPSRNSLETLRARIEIYSTSGKKSMSRGTTYPLLEALLMETAPSSGVTKLGGGLVDGPGAIPGDYPPRGRLTKSKAARERPTGKERGGRSDGSSSKCLLWSREQGRPLCGTGLWSRLVLTTAERLITSTASAVDTSTRRRKCSWIVVLIEKPFQLLHRGLWRASLWVMPDSLSPRGLSIFPRHEMKAVTHVL